LANALNIDVDEALLMAGHAPSDGNADPDGLYSGIKKLTPERQRLAKAQIKAIMSTLLAEQEHDTDYIEETEV
jgi:hypothetical protein